MNLDGDPETETKAGEVEVPHRSSETEFQGIAETSNTMGES